MTITLSYSWWMAPTLVTILAFLWWNFWPIPAHHGWFGGITLMFRAVPALLIVAIAWMVGAFLK